MSCHGCQILEKTCNPKCVIRQSTEWLSNGKSEANAALFMANFYGLTFLLDHLNAAPYSQRALVFWTLLYEAVARTVNPATGIVGLYATGNWHVCHSAVQTALNGQLKVPLHKTQEVSEVIRPTARPFDPSRPILIDSPPSDPPTGPKLLDLFS